jgi:hypothetical protein
VKRCFSPAMYSATKLRSILGCAARQVMQEMSSMASTFNRGKLEQVQMPQQGPPRER